MEGEEQKQTLPMSECIKLFIEGRPKRHQKQLIILGNLQKCVRQYILFSLFISP